LIVFSKLKYKVSLFLCLIGLGILGLGTGCARTVDPSSTLLTMEILLTFNGPIDSNKYSYYVAMSDTVVPKVPNIPPEDYLLTPGRPFNDGQNLFLAKGDNTPDIVATYYNDFFSTWSDYLVFSDGELQLYNSNATSFEATTTDNFTYEEEINFSPDLLESSGNTLKFQFTIQFLSAADPASLNLTFFTSERLPDSNDQAGLLRDILEDGASPQILIQKLEQEGPEPDLDDPTIPKAADLISWQVRII